MRHAAGLFAIPFAVSFVFAATVFGDTPRPPQNPGPQAAPTPPPQGAPRPDASALSERTSLLAPIQVESLTLTPIVALLPAAAGGKDDGKDNLLVLDEAMATKQVKIQEIADGSVNGLTFVNKADRPVFVMAGEVIIGGKQDRIIGRNTVIPAKTTQEVPVFCVEHGRWDGNTKEFTTAKALAHGRLRGQASYAAQQDVWNEVAAKNKVRKTQSASDTYRKVAQQQSDGTLSSMEKQVDAALARIPAADRARMVGYAVALNGNVATVDMFGSPALFKKLETKLVRSYLTEAVDVAAQKTIKPPSPADVKSFMADADKAAEQKSYDTAAAATVIHSGEHASKAQVDYKRAHAPTPAAAAPPALYENYQAH
jgi:ARG/rhodanese/phosphatase superfamily protein